MGRREAKTLLCILFAVLTAKAHASRTSFRNAHPIGWMHLLPVGEAPGWSQPQWTNIELNHANIWNGAFEMTDKRTDDVYKYEADYEQSSAILETGWALTDRMSFALEVPYANRNGGFLDDFIDQFHVLIGSNRFLRHLNDDYDNNFSIKTNGTEQLASKHGQGVGAIKAKVKLWLMQWRSPTPGVCDCGFAVSFQSKFPTQRPGIGLSSGHNDYSGLIHAGAPLWKYAGIWATAGWTKLGGNENLNGWPRREWLQMYELSLDLGVGPSFGFILQARTESPILMKEYLTYNYTTTERESQTSERIGSGWNSLVEWRGSQSIGVRWRWGQGSQINFMMVEDWGTGDKDERNDKLYVNNAPDVAFVSQWHFVF
jgi:hypothetical protein